MLLTDLTPEEREVYRTAFAVAAATMNRGPGVALPSGATADYAHVHGCFALEAWRTLLERQAKELEERNEHDR